MVEVMAACVREALEGLRAAMVASQRWSQQRAEEAARRFEEKVAGRLAEEEARRLAEEARRATEAAE